MAKKIVQSSLNESYKNVLKPYSSIHKIDKTSLNKSSLNKSSDNKSLLDNILNKISNKSILQEIKSSKIIFDLPVVLINKILSNLNLNELKKLRLINKKFKSIITNYYRSINELIIFNDHNLNILNHSWYFTSRGLNFNNCLNLNLRRKFFNNQFMKFKNLKNLKITSIITSNCFQFNDLNRFIGLEELDIKMINFNLENNDYLKLINLKYLSIDSRSPIMLTINTPNLIKFYYNHRLDNIKFIDYKSIIHLETIDYCGEVKKFVNLKYYYLIRAYQIDIQIFDHLIYLDELNFLSTTDREYLMNSFMNFYIDTYSKICKLFDEIKLKQLKTKIYLLGIRLDDKIDFYNIKFENNLNLHIKYYQFLNSNLKWFKSINHFNLIKNINGNLPQDFYDKFNNIQQFELYGSSFDQSFVYQFLNSTNLKFLKLINLNASNKFYHDLPKYCHNLSKLKICDEINIDINLECFNKFDLLCEFETNQDFKMENVFKLIESLSFFNMIQFYCRGRDYVKIKKFKCGQFYFRYFEYKDKNNKKKSINILGVESFNKVKEACFNLEKRSFFS